VEHLMAESGKQQLKIALPPDLVLRGWQGEAIVEFFRHLGKHFSQETWPIRPFLVEATPGAGKTVLKCAIAMNMLAQGLADWIVIAVPTDTLRTQFARDAVRFNLHLFHGLLPKGQRPSVKEYNGEVVTYAQVASRPEDWTQLCTQRRVFLSADEAHHLGDGLSWADKFRVSFDCSIAKLMTSGTPFRTDSRKIPWVHYESDGSDCWTARPDYRYSYGDALEDGVVRPILFPTWGAQASWSKGGAIANTSFDDPFASQSHRRTLRQIITDPDSIWFREVFAVAHRDLLEMRQRHPQAAGLVVTKSDEDARKAVDVIAEIANQKAALITSKTKEAKKRLKSFGKGNRENNCFWVVAVDMCAEGVDIPDWMQGIYASNKTTLMYFRQFVGRFVRKIGGIEDEIASVYAYPDPALLEHIENIRDEIAHVVEIKEDDDSDEGDVASCVEVESFPAEGDGEQLGLLSVPGFFSPRGRPLFRRQQDSRRSAEAS
jgi:superfamily II DNA or RNA helicase